MNEELGKNAAAEVQPASLGREVERDLLEALNQMYYAVLRVAPEEDAVTVLQSRDHPENVGKKLQWSAYLEHYRSMLTENGKKKLQERLSCQALQAAAKSKGEGRPGFTLEVSYSAGGRTNWLTMPVLIKQQEDDDTAVYVFVRKSNDEHLLKSIIDLYVYNTCDYFIYLNAKNNSYVMFSGSDSGTPLPPAAGGDYEAALVDYARQFVVPEDQEMVIREMHIGRVLDQLERPRRAYLLLRRHRPAARLHPQAADLPLLRPRRADDPAFAHRCDRRLFGRTRPSKRAAKGPRACKNRLADRALQLRRRRRARSRSAGPGNERCAAVYRPGRL